MADAIAFGVKNGLPLKPNEQRLEHFVRKKYDFDFSKFVHRFRISIDEIELFSKIDT